MANDLIFRAKHIEEFTVTTEVPDDFRFNGLVPFDMQITGSILEAKVWAIDFNEAVSKLHSFLETCK
jgi:nucleoside 2-deoxyribosyltransferase